MARIGETTTPHRSRRYNTARLRVLPPLFLGTALLLGAILVNTCNQHPQSGSTADSNSAETTGKAAADSAEAGGVDFYGDLKLGMSREEAFARLPEGVLADDLARSVKYNDPAVYCWTGDFPALRFPIIRDIGLPQGAVATLALWFDHDRLAALGLRIMYQDATAAQKSRLRDVLVEHYGDSDEERQSKGNSELLYMRGGSDNCAIQVCSDFYAETESTLITLTIKSNDDLAVERILSSGDDGTSTGERSLEIVLAHEKPIKRFETLRFGMSAEEALSHLPWGLTKKDLPLTWSEGDADYIYSEALPLSVWPPTMEAFKDKEGTFQLSLGFTKHGLQIVVIAVESNLADDGVVENMKHYLAKMYGARPLHDLSDGYETWGIYGNKEAATISRPFATPYPNFRMIVGTEDGRMAMENAGGRGQ